MYLYRVIAVSKAHNPATLAMVRSAVVHDAQLLAAYHADIKAGVKLASAAARIGLPVAAKKYHLAVFSPASFKALENQLVGITPDGQPQYALVPGHLPGVQVRSAKLMQAAFLLARQAMAKSNMADVSIKSGASQQKANTNGQSVAKLVLTHPCTSVDLDSQLAVFVLQLANAKPVPVNILHDSTDLAGVGRYLMGHLNESLLEQWFSYTAVTKRVGFVAND